MTESIHTIIVGGGQAGLSASYFLKKLALEHLVLDKAAQPADAWRNQRWDSFTLVTPNFSFRLPGAEYQGPDPHGFMKREEIVRRFEDYVRENELPVSYGVEAQCVQPEEGKSGWLVRTAGRDGKGSWLVRTSQRDYRARNVIIANGWFRVPKTPAFAARIPASIRQLQSGSYRNPQSIPPGAVLVIGSGQTGVQITEELYRSGRKVYLATGGAPRSPRRYRGKDIFEWLSQSGFFERPIEMFSHLPGRLFIAPQVTGRDGGHGLNLHQFHRDGVTLLGHARDYIDGQMIFAADLKENLARSDQGEKFLLKNIDDYIQQAGLNVPEEHLPALDDGYQAPEITSLDLQAAGITSIIWASGFRYDCSLVRLPVQDEYGYPITRGGVSSYPGLYFLGIPFLSKLKSGFIFGVSEDAAHITQHIAERG